MHALDSDPPHARKVSIPVDREISTKLRGFQLHHDPDNGVHELSSVSRLANVFSVEPLDEHLNIVEQPPPGEFIRPSRTITALILVPKTAYVSGHARKGSHPPHIAS